MANILYDNCFHSTYRTFVKEVKEENGLYWHYLDETIFYVESGGQVSDEGMINQHKVLALKKEGNAIWHLLDTKIEGNVELVVDFHLRFHHAQNHTAQHLISGIVESVYGCNTIAHHVHDNCCDIEFDREVLNQRQINELKVILNGLIRDDLPVKIFYPTLQEAAYYTTKDVSHFDEIRMVAIGKISVDPCACIHVPSLRYLQAITILDVEKTKNGMKLYYICGDQLLHTFDENYSYLKKAGNLLAQPFQYVESGILNIQQEIKNLTADIQLLKQRYMESVCTSLLKKENVYHKFEDIDLKTFALGCKWFMKAYEGNFIFSCVNKERIHLFVHTENSDKIFADIADKFQLHGGGNKKSAQGGGMYREEIESYVLKLLG